MKKPLIFAACIILLIGGLSIALPLILSSPRVMFYVNGDAVGKVEFDLFLTKHRSSAFAYFKDRYGAQYTKEFWASDFGGENPSDHLKKMARDELTRMRVIQQMAREYGIFGEFDFNALLEEMSKENSSRLQASKNNRPVIGPIEFGERDYYEYRMENLYNVLRDRWGRQVLNPSDEVLRAYFDEDPARYAKPGGQVYTVFTAADVNEIETAERFLRNGLTELEHMRGLSSMILLSLTARELTINGDNIRKLSADSPNLVEAAVALYPGKHSAIFEEGGQWHVVLCTAELGGIIPEFKEVKDAVRVDYFGEKFEAYLCSLVEAAEVKVTGRYNSLRIK